MRVLILSEHDIRALLPYADCVEVMRDALGALDRGEVHQPLRSLVRADGAPGFLGLMPAHRAHGAGGYGLKAVCVYPDNPKRGLDTHVGAVLLFERETGQLLAVMNASTITEIRTAAVSALATSLLARPDARILTIFGTGTQARSHLEALCAVERFTEVRVAGRTLEAAQRFVDTHRELVTATLHASPSPEAALDGAGVVVTATSAKTPILRREWIADGTHINAVGSSVRSTREIDGPTMRDAAIFVDRRESTVNESGDFLMAKEEGHVTDASIRATLGELVNGAERGRRDDGEITLFKSLGLAIEDLATAEFLRARALERGAGTSVEL